jgi:hypothetical protein
MILKVTYGTLQWIHKHNLLTPLSTHEKTPHQAMWLYQAVVAGEKVSLAISNGGKTLFIAWDFISVGGDNELL